MFDYDMGGGIRYDSEEYRKNIQDVEWHPEWNSDKMELPKINADGGPGSGRYPKGSGKKNHKSLKMTAKEREKVTHDINNVWHARFKGLTTCMIVTYSNKNNSLAYVYRFRNHGFDDYEFLTKELHED